MLRAVSSRVRPLSVIGALVLLTCLQPVEAQPQQARLPRLEPRPCGFGPSLEAAKVECSWLVVAESRERADSREIRLAVAVLRASKPTGAAPLVMLHGGPGGSGLRGANPARAFTSPWGSGVRDVVIYDQRGGGVSEPKLCLDYGIALDEARVLPTPAERDDRRARGARECIASLRAQHVDPAAYNTTTNALDMIDLRKALGYAQWDLYGGSYGGKLAQEAMLRDGGAVRSVLLLWPAMRGAAQQAELASALQSAIERVFTECAKQEPCRAAFPDPRADFYADYEELTEKPLLLPRAGDRDETIRLDGPRLVSIIANEILTRPARIRQLPFLLHELRVGDRLRAATTVVSFVEPYEGPSENGVVNSLIRCFDSYGPEAVARQNELNGTIPAPYRNDTLRECPLWQERFASAEDRVPVRSNIPTLIFTAEFDERTPTEHGRRIAATLGRAHLLELPNVGHGTLYPAMTGCVDGLITRFFANPLAMPDASCLAQIPRLQFATGW
jgi:pimeloyl-ACP methyl ester carboxylesterase